MENWWDKYDTEESADKPEHAWWRKYDEEEKKPYSRRGSVEARNKQAEPDILSARAQRFQMGNELDAELPAFMGLGEDILAHPQRVEAAAATIRPDLPTGVNAASYEQFMDAERGGMGVTPGTGRAMEDATVTGQNLGVVGAKFREGWRTTKAGMAADEYLRTGKVTLQHEVRGRDRGLLVEGKYLTGPEAERYIRELASPTEDAALVEAFDKQVGAGARALTTTLAQPEQLLSIPGGMAGMAVGAPTIGAAIGAAPSTIKGYYSELLANLQAGISPEQARANALAGAGIDQLTETLGGRFGAEGGILKTIGTSAAEESAAELGRIGSDYAFSLAEEKFAAKLPKTFGEGAERVAESGIAGALGAGIMVGAPRALSTGVAAAREMLAKSGGISDGRPDAKDTRSSVKIDPKINEGLETSTRTLTLPKASWEAMSPATQATIMKGGVVASDDGKSVTIDYSPSAQPKANAPSYVVPSSIAPVNIDTVEAPSTTVTNIEEAKRDSVNPAGDSKKREIPTNGVTPSSAPLATVQLSTPEVATAEMPATTTQEPLQALPATRVATPAENAPVTSQSVDLAQVNTTPPAASTEAVPAVVQSPVTSQQVPQVSNTPKPKKERKAPAPKPLTDGQALAQAYTELQTRAASDPEFQKATVANPAMMRQMATQRAAELVAQSKQVTAAKQPKVEPAPTTGTTVPVSGTTREPVAQPAPTVAAPETPTLDLATPDTTRPKFASKDEFFTELYSGVGDKEAIEARKVQDKIVVYDGDADLASIDPDVAAKVQEAVQKQGATGARPKAFQYNGKVYFNMEGVKPGEAKSTFLHEARVHLAAKAEPARVSALASRVVALAKAGDATARAAADTVRREYPGVAEKAKEGNDSAKDLSREELLADFAQRVYDRVKSGQGVSGTIKRLYSDVMSYLRDLYTTAAKKYLGERFALSITDVDILDAVRYGRTAAGFKGEAKPTRLAEAAQKSKDATPTFSLTTDKVQPDTGGVELPEGSKISRGVNKAIDKGVALLRPRGTASREAQLMGERAVGTSNELRIAGEVLVKELIGELDTVLAGESPRKQAMYRYDIGQYLAGNKALGANVPKNIRDTVDAMRLMLDNNTLKLIALGAVKPADIPKMLNNMGRWIHRDFEVFHNKPGDVLNPGEYQRLVQAMAEDGNDIVASVLPDVMEELKLPSADVLNKLGEIAGKKGGKKAWRQESVNTVREVQGKTPLTKDTKKTNKEIRKQAERYLRNMAGKWGIGSGTPLGGPDGIVARLAALSSNGTADLEAAAKRYANLMLDPKANPYQDSLEIPDRKNPLGIDDTALSKVRKDVPEWLRTIWGQFKDPVPMFLVSLDNQADIIAKFTALAEYKQKGLANGNVVPNKAGMADFNMRKKGYHLLQKPGDPLYYGPLDNTYVKLRDLPMLEVAALKDFVARQIRQSMGSKWLRPLAAAGQPVKMMLVAGDYTSQMVQAASALVFYSGLNFGKIPAAFQGARYTSFGGTSLGKAISNKTLDEDVKAWIAQGVLVNNALAGDARRKLVEFVQQPGEQFIPDIVRKGRQAKRLYGKATDAVSRVMSLPDEMAKIMMAYGRMDSLANIYPNKTREELRELAGDETMGTTPTLNREAPLARYLANSGVVNPFATFLASNFRNFYNHFELAAKYGRMPGKAAKMYAARELMMVSLKAGTIHATMQGLIWTGTAAAAAAQYGFASMMQALGADDDEQEEIKRQAEAGAKAQKEHYQALRALVPDWQLGEVSITREMEPDVYVYASIQRFDPSPIGSIMSAVGRDDWSEVGEVIKSNLFSEAPVVKGLATMLMYAPTAAGEAANEQIIGDSYQTNARDAEEVRKFWQEGAKEVALAYTPGSFKRAYKQLTSDEDYTALETVIMNTGGTVGVLDVRARVGEVAGDYMSLVDSSKKALSKAASANEGLLETKLDIEQDLVTRAKAWKNARAKISAAQELGKSDGWIKDAIKSNPYTSSMSKDEINSLLDGTFRVPDYQEWLDKQYEADTKNPKNARRLDEVNAQYARYGQELQQLHDGLADLLKKQEVEQWR